MDASKTPYARDALREVSVYHHPTATPLELVLRSASDAVDLSPYVTQCRQSASEVSITLTWHTQLYGAAQPKPGEIIEIELDGDQLWWGVIESLNDYRLESGTRTLTITARTRDASPFWREVRRVTDIYPTMTPLALIAQEVAASLGVSVDEMRLPSSSGYTTGSGTQLAELSGWDMLEQLFAPAGIQPFVDAHGVLKTISRDLSRPVDVELTEDRIVAVTGARSKAPLTAVKVLWLDPSLTRVEQQDSVLATATITAGYFQPKQSQNVSFSEDGTQRAVNTYLSIKQSCNSGLLDVADEDYEQLSLTGGRITLTTAFWVSGLLGVFLAMKAASAIPDGVALLATIPNGKIVQGALELSALLVMASIGTGMYEIKGTPYDYVYARNQTEAFDSSAPAWMERVEEVETDFVSNESDAQAFATRELIYRARSASSYGMTIVDDPRVEPGDIVSFPDGTRVYCTGYNRDLSPGAPALLAIDGFQI